MQINLLDVQRANGDNYGEHKLYPQRRNIKLGRSDKNCDAAKDIEDYLRPNKDMHPRALAILLAIMIFTYVVEETNLRYGKKINANGRYSHYVGGKQSVEHPRRVTLKIGIVRSRGVVAVDEGMKVRDEEYGVMDEGYSHNRQRHIDAKLIRHVDLRIHECLKTGIDDDYLHEKDGWNDKLVHVLIVITEDNGYEHQEVYEAFHEDAGGNEVLAIDVRLVVGERRLDALCEIEHRRQRETRGRNYDVGDIYDKIDTVSSNFHNTLVLVCFAKVMK